MLVVVTGDAPELALRGRRTRTFRWLAKAALREEIPVFFTTPKYFQWPEAVASGWKSAKTRGWRYDATTDRFVEDAKSLDPERVVVYDAMYLDDLKRHDVRYHQLYRAWRRHNYRFFNPIFPSKDVIYRILSGHDLSPAKLPETFMDITPQAVLRLLERKSRLWLKPNIGSGGRNIAVVERISDGLYRVVGERFFGKSIHRELSTRKLLELLEDAFRRRTYTAQEEIQLLRTKTGQKVDFRATVMRYDNREWRTIALTARIGSKGSTLTNFHAGGRAHSVSDSLPDEIEMPASQQKQLLRSVREAGVRVAEALSAHVGSVGLVGVDFGAAKDGSLYAYDCNGRPGRDILRDEEIREAMEAIVSYSGFLLRGRKVHAGHGKDDIRRERSDGPSRALGAQGTGKKEEVHAKEPRERKGHTRMSISNARPTLQLHRR